MNSDYGEVQNYLKAIKTQEVLLKGAWFGCYGCELEACGG
jgi:hypothetical protein